MINTTKGLNTPPVKNNNPTNCEISNIKNKKVFLSVKVEFPLWIKQEKKFTKIENKTTIKHSVKGMVKLKTKEIVNKVINCPKIAVHLIFIRFANKTVFTD